MKNPVVTIEMENGNQMKVELYPEIAPNTVKNFVSLVRKGFYDGVIFHRVIPGEQGLAVLATALRGNFRPTGLKIP